MMWAILLMFSSISKDCALGGQILVAVILLQSSVYSSNKAPRLVAFRASHSAYTCRSNSEESPHGKVGRWLEDPPDGGSSIPGSRARSQTGREPIPTQAAMSGGEGDHPEDAQLREPAWRAERDPKGGAPKRDLPQRPGEAEARGHEEPDAGLQARPSPPKLAVLFTSILN